MKSSQILVKSNNPKAKNSKLITHNGETRTLKEWAEIKGIKYSTLLGRLNIHGWTFAEAIGEKPRSRNWGKQISYKGETHNMTGWAKIKGISYVALRDRLKRGWTFKEAISRPVTGTVKERAMEYNNLEILATLWYGKLGIIKAKDKITNEIKIYIGEGFGEDKQTDIYRIVSFGTKYTPESFKQLVDWLEASNAQNQEQS